MIKAFPFILLSVFWLRSMAQPKIQFVTPSVIRVQWTPDGVARDNGTGVCVYRPQDVATDVEHTPAKDIYRSSELTVEMDKKTWALTFRDNKDGKVLLSENPLKPREYEKVAQERIVYDDASAHIEETANGKVTVKDILYRDTVGFCNRYRANFIFDNDEAIYGLGAHMEDYMNLLGKTLYLTQHNLKATVPMLNSTGGFGLLFDAGCAMKFSSSRRLSGDGYDGTMELEASNELDYYFIKGERMDDVVSGYRYLTGAVSLMPRYLFGYIQSKERYVSSEDLLNTLREYRRRHVPIDMIVQDWNYWPEGWGYMKMNRKYYPDPKALADSVHAMHARLMVSIWPNPQYCPQERDFRQKGYMLEHSVYDVFNPEARKLYWKYADEEFFSNGFDAWWCDSSEPLDGDWNRPPAAENGREYGWDEHERRWKLNKEILSSALGAERSNLYSLYHSMGIYENQRLATDEKRVVNLTRSSYAGQQRYGTIVWNGDTHASWESFRQQIPSGLNYMATGNPYWTVDVGSFFTRNGGRWFYKGKFPEGVRDDAYKEYYTRMFQWATFLPVLRSHGSDTPREIWHFGRPGTPYYDAILKMINLRYSLIPYIYSMAAWQTFGDYTMARPLAFDFPGDKRTFDLKDEYMFGDMLVCPVTSPGVATRKVYLPDDGGNTLWTDYWTGTAYKGGQWIECESPIDRLPLFVLAGSIIPSVEPEEYAEAQVGKPLTLNVYPGRDAEYDLYEDAGDGYGYERGEYSMLKIRWNDAKKRLVIENHAGKPKETIKERIFVVKSPDAVRAVKYTGKKIKVKL